MKVNQATEQLRHKVLRGLTLSIVIATAIITVINYLNDNVIFSIVDGLLCLYCSAIFYQLSAKPYQTWQSVSIVYLYILAVSLVSIAGGLLSGLPFWLLTFPILLYLIFGKKHGFFSSAILLVIETIILYFSTKITDDTAVVSILMNLILAYFVIWTVAHLYEHNRELNEKQLFDLALRDPLTHSYNRLALTSSFTNNKTLPQYTLAMIDIDHFKNINDNYGHDAGDQVLIQLVQRLNNNLDNKCIFRIGGEEFVIIFTNLARNNTISLMETIRESIEATHFIHHDLTLKITISIGLSATTKSCTLSELLKQADSCLYMAKRNGRNQLVHDLCQNPPTVPLT